MPCDRIKLSAHRPAWVWVAAKSHHRVQQVTAGETTALSQTNVRSRLVRPLRNSAVRYTCLGLPAKRPRISGDPIFPNQPQDQLTPRPHAACVRPNHSCARRLRFPQPRLATIFREDPPNLNVLSRLARYQHPAPDMRQRRVSSGALPMNLRASQHLSRAANRQRAALPAKRTTSNDDLNPRSHGHHVSAGHGSQASGSITPVIDPAGQSPEGCRTRRI